MPVLNIQSLIDNRVSAIQKMHSDTNSPRAQLDVSGGVDSAVMLGLLEQAVGADNITAVYSGINSSEESLTRAQEVADAFSVNLISIDLSETYGELVSKMVTSLEASGMDSATIQQRYMSDPTILGSIRSCIRAPVGRGFNRLAGNGIRHGTGNECEDRWLRFFQKGGDGEVDSNPVAMLSKGEIYQLAIGLGVPQATVDALPTPDLQAVGEDHNDEDELLAMTGMPFTYSRVDFTTSQYTTIGTIEQVSRFADNYSLFSGNQKLTDSELTTLATLAKNLGFFPQFSENDAKSFLAAANTTELQTRHKENPNCPSLGDRQTLIDSGILTNTLF